VQQLWCNTIWNLRCAKPRGTAMQKIQDRLADVDDSSVDLYQIKNQLTLRHFYDILHTIVIWCVVQTPFHDSVLWRNLNEQTEAVS
jgi:hypothetical protein